MLDWSNCGQVHAVHIVSLWMGNRKRYVDNCYVADFMAVCGDPLEGLGSVFLVWPSLDPAPSPRHAVEGLIWKA